VNKEAKPARMLRNILEWFTHEGDTVMDFFSGGNLMRVALQEQRECL
jgi:DNA modification methylase